MTTKTILIACEVVVRELSHRIDPDLPVRVIDPSLHVHPDRLRATLQRAIDEEERKYDRIILGYGLCSRSLEGLTSRNATLVFPLVDDCIGLFLGSKTAHLQQLKSAPGAFFLSRGWIETGSTPFREHDYMVKRFGPDRTKRLMKTLLNHYTHLTFIDLTGSPDSSEYQAYAREKALEFDLKYGEISGASALFDQLINGRNSDQLAILAPGDSIRFEMFINGPEPGSGTENREDKR